MKCSYLQNTQNANMELSEEEYKDSIEILYASCTYPKDDNWMYDREKYGYHNLKLTFTNRQLTEVELIND